MDFRRATTGDEDEKTDSAIAAIEENVRTLLTSVQLVVAAIGTQLENLKLARHAKSEAQRVLAEQNAKVADEKKMRMKRQQQKVSRRKNVDVKVAGRVGRAHVGQQKNGHHHHPAHSNRSARTARVPHSVHQIGKESVTSVRVFPLDTDTALGHMGNAITKCGEIFNELQQKHPWSGEGGPYRLMVAGGKTYMDLRADWDQPEINDAAMMVKSRTPRDSIVCPSIEWRGKVVMYTKELSLVLVCFDSDLADKLAMMVTELMKKYEMYQTVFGGDDDYADLEHYQKDFLAFDICTNGYGATENKEEDKEEEDEDEEDEVTSGDDCEDVVKKPQEVQSINCKEGSWEVTTGQ